MARGGGGESQGGVDNVRENKSYGVTCEGQQVNQLTKSESRKLQPPLNAPPARAKAVNDGGWTEVKAIQTFNPPQEPRG